MDKLHWKIGINLGLVILSIWLLYPTVDWYTKTPDERAKLEELWGTVERWVHENDVSCPEVISQSDSVNLSLADLVASLVEIVGFEEDRGDL